MKLSIRRIYCWNCRRLVRCREHKEDGHTEIMCSRCGKLLYLWNGIFWKSM